MMCGGFFCLSGLALSVKACRLCQLSQRESPWHNGKVSGIVQRRPLGGAGERSEPEGVASALPKAALQMSSPATTPPVKIGYRNARRRSDIPKFKIILPLMMPRAQRRAFQIVLFARKGCLRRKQQTAFSASRPAICAIVTSFREKVSPSRWRNAKAGRGRKEL